jgi:hypothetical protein
MTDGHACCGHDHDHDEPGADDALEFIRLGVETRQWAWAEMTDYEGTFEDKLLAARRLAVWALTGGKLVLEDEEEELPGEAKVAPLKPGEPGDWH